MKSKPVKPNKRSISVEDKKDRKVGSSDKGQEVTGTITEGGRQVNPDEVKPPKV
jgi:hypothetical protein